MENKLLQQSIFIGVDLALGSGSQGTGEIAQLVKCSQGKLEDLGSNPSTGVKQA